jgi:hypothetical protein
MNRYGNSMKQGKPGKQGKLGKLGKQFKKSEIDRTD